MDRVNSARRRAFSRWRRRRTRAHRLAIAELALDRAFELGASLRIDWRVLLFEAAA